MCGDISIVLVRYHCFRWRASAYVGRLLSGLTSNSQHHSTQPVGKQPAAGKVVFIHHTVKMSHHCHDEHAEGGGHHDHDGHDHSDDITPAIQFSLYQHIDFDQITTMNESQYGSGKAIVKKTWAQRLEDEPELASDADEQLILNVP